MKVWLVAYHHRYGIDFISYEDAGQAHHGAAVLAAREAPNECTAEVALQIQSFFNLGHDAEALALYCKHTDESFEVHELEITPGAVFNMPIAEADTEVVHATRGWPRGDIDPGVTWCDRTFWWSAQEVIHHTVAMSFRAWIPKERRFVTCITCAATEGAHGRAR